MNIRHVQRAAIGFMAVFLMTFSGTAVLSAQSQDGVTNELLETIRIRCSNSQFALQQIEKRDAVSRINRGRAYDQMLRQILAFNSRFAYNKISEPKLGEATTDLQKAVDDFRAAYDRYDTDISDALNIDCREKPSEYYAVIVQAREDRNAVGQQVQKIEQLIQDYRAAVVKYGETLQ